MDNGKPRLFNGEYTLSTIPRPNRPMRSARKADISQINWEMVRQKISGAGAGQNWTDEIPQDVLEQVWARRAAQIARAIEDGESGEQIDIAVIRVGREVYGLEVDYIFDIRVMGSVTCVPRVPDWMAGVTNLRGRIISVLNIQRFLGLPPTDGAVSYTHRRAHETPEHLVCRLLLEKKKHTNTPYGLHASTPIKPHRKPLQPQPTTHTILPLYALPTS